MIQHPAIFALNTGAALSASFLLYACRIGTSVWRRWDPESGDELQLTLERQTYLVSTIVSYILAFQIVSLLLFIFTADRLHPLFSGAMCATGVLNLNGSGYPALALKSINAVAAGVWLIINHADSKTCDSPLIKQKYALLFLITLLSILELFLQLRFFSALKPEVITSCCGTLFGSEQSGVVSFAECSFPIATIRTLFLCSMTATVITGIAVYVRRSGFLLYALMSTATFFVSLVALVSWISIYIYELPTHHCPFCILQSGYHFVGYPLYAALLLSLTTGFAAGLLSRFRKMLSLKRFTTDIQRRLVLFSVSGYFIFMAIVMLEVALSDLRL